MKPAHDDANTTWRDLADQLTPKQTKKLAELEQRCRLPSGQKNEALLAGARKFAQENLVAQVVFGHLTHPEGATTVYPGGERTDGQGWSREFTGTKRKVCGVQVLIEGTQFAEGRSVREIYVTVSELGETAMSNLDADGARLLASKLIEAADELERLQ